MPSCGLVLIEMGRLDGAEKAFHSSLEIEPGNALALNELSYIEELRAGGEPSQGEAVSSQAPSLAQCAVCGRGFERGVVIAQGVLRTVCETCERKLARKWWQCWK